MHRPQKKWGQNFLRNPGAIRRIVETLDAKAGETIVEVGPGEGALTEALIAQGHHPIAIEIDPLLVAALRERFGERITVVEGDALEAGLPSNPFCAVGNLPYNAGTPILRRFIAHPLCRRSLFMLQKEVADRLVARPGDEAYGYLTLYCRLYADANIVLTLGPGSFRPSPKVWSAVVRLERVERPTVSRRETLEALLSASFRMRRKQLTNNLAAAFDLPKLELDQIIESVGLSRDVRAERVTLEEFDRLAAAIEPHAVARARPE